MPLAEHPNKRISTTITAVTVISPPDNENLDFSPINTFCTPGDETMMINTCKNCSSFAQSCTPDLLNLQWNNLSFLYLNFWPENLHLEHIIRTLISDRFYAITSTSLSFLFSHVAVYIRKSWNKKLFSVNKVFCKIKKKALFYLKRQTCNDPKIKQKNPTFLSESLTQIKFQSFLQNYTQTSICVKNGKTCSTLLKNPPQIS